MTIIDVDIEEYYDPFQASIYPNPAKEVLNIDLQGEFENVILRIIDMAGKIVFSKEMTENKEQIDLIDLNAGIYNLEINSIEHQITRVFTVK